MFTSRSAALVGFVLAVSVAGSARGDDATTIVETDNTYNNSYTINQAVDTSSIQMNTFSGVIFATTWGINPILAAIFGSDSDGLGEFSVVEVLKDAGKGFNLPTQYISPVPNPIGMAMYDTAFADASTQNAYLAIMNALPAALTTAASSTSASNHIFQFIQGAPQDISQEVNALAGLQVQQVTNETMATNLQQMLDNAANSAAAFTGAGSGSTSNKVLSSVSVAVGLPAAGVSLSSGSALDLTSVVKK